MYENVWLQQQHFEQAEANYYRQLAGTSAAPVKPAAAAPPQTTEVNWESWKLFCKLLLFVCVCVYVTHAFECTYLTNKNKITGTRFNLVNFNTRETLVCVLAVSSMQVLDHYLVFILKKNFRGGKGVSMAI